MLVFRSGFVHPWRREGEARPKPRMDRVAPRIVLGSNSLAGCGVFAVENSGPLEHDVMLIHNCFMNREPIRLTRVNE